MYLLKNFWLGVVVHICDLSMLEVVGRKILVQGRPRAKKHETLSKNND
jgi:phosphoserine phosphatase